MESVVVVSLSHPIAVSGEGEEKALRLLARRFGVSSKQLDQLQLIERTVHHDLGFEKGTLVRVLASGVRFVSTVALRRYALA